MFAIPSVTSQRIEMHTCHPPPSYLTRQKHIEERLQSELSDKLHILHPIIRGQLLQFPEVRLIQYDCGRFILMSADSYSKLVCTVCPPPQKKRLTFEVNRLCRMFEFECMFDVKAKSFNACVILQTLRGFVFCILQYRAYKKTQPFYILKYSLCFEAQ